MKKLIKTVILIWAGVFLITGTCMGLNEKPVKYILTGGPGSGKTSTIFALEQLHGEAIIAEAATDYFLLKQAQGITEPWKLENFQAEILELQLKREAWANITGAKRVFSDRSPIDGLAYVSHAIPELDAVIERIASDPSYSKTVFLIENLGHCRHNGVRPENQEESLKLETAQEINYKKHGFTVVRIAPGTVEERALKILKHVEGEETKTISCVE